MKRIIKTTKGKDSKWDHDFEIYLVDFNQA